MAETHTIAAIATAVGGGVGIVRLSGPRAEALVRAVVPSFPRGAASHRLFLGAARDPHSGAILDEVLAVVMRAPRSYTGEDVAELQGHGGAAAMQALLEAVVAAGARLATPGEFTRRAFLAGRMDLTQAEAVALLVSAADARALRAAQALRRGALGAEIAAARARLVAQLAEIEGALDFPDDAGAVDHDAARARLAALADQVAALGAGYRRPLGVVPEILLAGSANAGKSSLLNALCGHERALVDDRPGTTRDLVEVDVVLEGTGRVRLVDTAGVHARPDALEARGQALAEARRADAQLVLLVYDGAAGWSAVDEAVHAALCAQALPVIVIENKRDLPRAQVQAPVDGVRISARDGAGLDALRAAITAALGEGDEAALPIASARQAAALAAAAQAIARGAALPADAAELTAVELRHALHQLGLVTGETVDEDVLDALFARFCIGK